jgi:hypothetical protein
MSKLVLAALIAFCSLSVNASVAAQTNNRQQINQIEQEYSRLHNGRVIPDDQLEYYLDRSESGWSMNQIQQDMANSQRQSASNQWRPHAGWVAREVICSSDSNRYHECALPFQGSVRLTEQISDSACIENRTWGQKPGKIWVNNGCRARFGVSGGYNNGNGYGRQFACVSNRGQYRECDVGNRGRVELVSRLSNSIACVEGQTWGQSAGKVWVGNGCRANFRVAHGNSNGNLPNNYSITCSSTGSDRTQCRWDPRYGSPRVTKQLSQSACVEGRSWGYDNRGMVWVDNGCRAEFGNR